MCSVCGYDNGSGKKPTDPTTEEPKVKKLGFENAKITILIDDKVKSNFINPTNQKVTITATYNKKKYTKKITVK